MPTYVYRFLDCEGTIEVQQSFSDDALTEVLNPADGKVHPVKKVFTPVGVSFKGNGFYKTDSRGKSSSSSGGSSGSTSSSESSSGESSSGSSSDSGTAKTETKSDSSSTSSSTPSSTPSGSSANGGSSAHTHSHGPGSHTH